MSDDKTRAKKSLPRKPARFPVDMPANFRVKGEKDWHRGTLVNLSTGGMCLQTTADLKTGQVLEMQIDTVDRSRRKHRRVVSARVIWRRLTRHGLQFTRSAAKVRNT